MIEKDEEAELLKHKKGILKYEEAKEVGVDYLSLQRLYQSRQNGMLKHDFYADPDQMEDVYRSTQNSCRKGIFSHETALYFHDLTDRTPSHLMLTVPSGYNTRLIKEKEQFKIFYIEGKHHTVGRISMDKTWSNQVYIYDKERTICDCLKKKDQLDLDLVLAAVKRYMKDPGADFALLVKYAEIFKIQKLAHHYLELLS